MVSGPTRYVADCVWRGTGTAFGFARIVILMIVVHWGVWLIARRYRDDVKYNQLVINGGLMPCTVDPRLLYPTPRALALVEWWQYETRNKRLPAGEELALWWVDHLPGDDDGVKYQDRTLHEARKRWRRFARHVHLWTYLHETRRIDLVAMELGVEGDWIPEPIVDVDGGVVRNLTWRTPTHWQAAHPPLGFRQWDIPLRCVGYVRPDWRMAALDPNDRLARNPASWWI